MADPSPRRFSIQAVEAPEFTKVVAFHGELDYADATEAGAALTAALAGAETRTLIVDVSGLDFIDSSGISEIVAAARTAKTRGREFVVAAPNRNIARVFEIVRLADLVRIEPSVAVARAQHLVD